MAGDSEQTAGGWRGAEPGVAGDSRDSEPQATGAIREGESPAGRGVPEDESGDAPSLPAGPAGQVQSTGEPRVDAALARLDELSGLPVTEHTRVFDDVHRRLEDVLGELGTGAAAETPR